eukprot:7220885-Alexandrium_andersonii.AAC.1
MPRKNWTSRAKPGDANPVQRRSSAREACRSSPLERGDDPVDVPPQMLLPTTAAAAARAAAMARK